MRDVIQVERAASNAKHNFEATPFSRNRFDGMHRGILTMIDVFSLVLTALKLRRLCRRSRWARWAVWANRGRVRWWRVRLNLGFTYVIYFIQTSFASLLFFVHLHHACCIAVNPLDSTTILSSNLDFALCRDYFRDLVHPPTGSLASDWNRPSAQKQTVA